MSALPESLPTAHQLRQRAKELIRMADAIEMAEKRLESVGNLPPLAIVEMTAAAFGVTVQRMTSWQRDKKTASARSMAYYLLRKHTEYSTPRIGRMLNRDHSTVVVMSRVVEKRLERDFTLMRIFEDLERQIALRQQGAAA